MATGRKSAADSYVNVAAVKVQETAANTFTAAKFAFPFSIMDKMGLIINRIEYWFEAMAQMNSVEDSIHALLTAASSVVDITNQADPLIIDSYRIVREDVGVAASGLYVLQPFVKDFSALPGGGILVAPSPLYAAIKGTGCAAVTACWLKLFYTYIELATDDYWQLVESRRIISS